jgi:hypothetical protein
MLKDSKRSTLRLKRFSAECRHEFVSIGSAKKLRARFSPFATPSRSRQLKSASLQTKEREAVVIPLPNSMHTGQIIMLTKMLTSSDLRFYEFEDDVPVHRWQSLPSCSS